MEMREPVFVEGFNRRADGSHDCEACGAHLPDRHAASDHSEFCTTIKVDGGRAKRLMDEKMEAGRWGYNAAKQPPHGPIYEAAVRYHAAIRAWQASEGGRAQTEEANAATEALHAMDKAIENLARGVAGEPIDPSAMLSALDPAEPAHITLEAERRLARVANTDTDVSQAMKEIKSLRTRLRHAVEPMSDQIALAADAARRAAESQRGVRVPGLFGGGGILPDEMRAACSCPCADDGYHRADCRLATP